MDVAACTIVEKMNACKERLPMNRSGNCDTSCGTGFSVVEGGAARSHAESSHSAVRQGASDLPPGFIRDDLMLMLLGLLTCSEEFDEPTVERPIDPCALDAIIERLIADGSVVRDQHSSMLHVTERGRADSAFLLQAWRGFESLLAQAAALGAMPDDSPARRGEPVRAFAFHVDLDLGDLHPCWREVIVPASMPFDVFHMAIQSAFLFVDCHLYDFELRTHGEMVRIAEPDNFVENGFISARSFPRNIDATQIRLEDVFPRTRTARYAYDYGDGWEFKIKLVEVLDSYEGPWPYCRKGSGDAPPEDVGGVCGFEQFLHAISDPDDQEHDSLFEWGRSQLWEPFDLDAVNHRIAIWPTSEFDRQWNEAHEDCP